MRRRSTTILAAALAAVLLTGACNAQQAPSARPSAPTTPTQLPTVTPTKVPKIEVPADATQYTKGEATLTLSGDVKADLTLPIAPGSLLTAGGMALSFVDEGGNFFGFGGTAFDGERETSATLSVTITMVKPTTAFFVSIAGECLLTLDRAGKDGAAGSFRCTKLRSSGATVDASGEFTAAA